MRSTLVLASVFAVMLALLAPLEAEAVECAGDRTYDTAVADGCTSISGDLLIHRKNTTNLGGLSALTSVGGELWITNNMTLANIDGLSGLTSVGYLNINGNNVLSNINGLSTLSELLTSLDIQNNPSLINLQGLSALTDVDSVYIVNNASLTDIDGLAALTDVGGDLYIRDNISLCQASVDDLLSQITVGGSILNISGNTGSCEPTCGDGNVEAGEACDDGNNLDGDCCSSTCEIESSGTVCGPTTDICDIEEVCDGTSPTCPADERLPDTDTDGTCDAYDVCPDDPDPSQADTDEVGLGDACDPCTGGIMAYKPLLKATNFATASADDKLKYKAKLIFDEAVSISPQNQGFRLLVEDADSDVLIDLDIPSGLYDPIARSGWIPTPNGKKFQYITKTPVDGMLPKVILKWNPKKANEVLVIVKGKSGNFADPNITLPLKATVSLDPTDAMTSLCAEAEFPGPKPLPYCRMSGNGVSVTCK